MKNKKFNIERNFFVSTSNACTSKSFLKNIVLHSLLVSHGIRVDASLYIIEDKTTYYLDGYELRHLHAQDASLEGFLDKLLCRKKLFPGTRLYPRILAEETLACSDLLITNANDIASNIANVRIYPGKNMLKISIIDKESYQSLDLDKKIKLKTLISLDKIENTVTLIVLSNYLIDKRIGAWIRRRGKIEYRRSI